MTPERNSEARVDDELDVLAALVPIAGREIVELGCGAAALARALLARHPDSRVTGLEVDERQHAKNLASPQPGLQFVASGAQSIPAADASFDVALMLKSLHHVPMPLLAQALTEVARVLRPRGTLYVSEPVFGGPLNDVTRLFNDEGVVRAAAQAAVDAALAAGVWEQVAERRFEMPARFKDFADFEQRMMRPTFADHRIDDAKLAEVKAAFTPHMKSDGEPPETLSPGGIASSGGRAAASGPEERRGRCPDRRDPPFQVRRHGAICIGQHRAARRSVRRRLRRGVLSGWPRPSLGSCRRRRLHQADRNDECRRQDGGCRLPRPGGVSPHQDRR